MTNYVERFRQSKWTRVRFSPSPPHYKKIPKYWDFFIFIVHFFTWYSNIMARICVPLHTVSSAHPELAFACSRAVSLYSTIDAHSPSRLNTFSPSPPHYKKIPKYWDFFCFYRSLFYLVFKYNGENLCAFARVFVSHFSHK